MVELTVLLTKEKFVLSLIGFFNEGDINSFIGGFIGERIRKLQEIVKICDVTLSITRINQFIEGDLNPNLDCIITEFKKNFSEVKFVFDI
jgi:hypothetical protein